MFQIRNPLRRQPITTEVPKSKLNEDNICKIVTKKVGNRTEKSIQGNCTPAQLRALMSSGNPDYDDEEE